MDKRLTPRQFFQLSEQSHGLSSRKQNALRAATEELGFPMDEPAAPEFWRISEQHLSSVFQQEKFSFREQQAVIPAQAATTASEAKLERLANIVEKLLFVQQVEAAVGRDALSYTSGKITQQRDPSFRRDVLQSYGYTPAQCDSSAARLPCLILDRDVPSESLVVGHIFKHEWAAISQRMMNFDINDARNGLPIFKPIEDAFDTLRLCIIVEETVAAEKFIVKVLDPLLLDVLLVDRATQLGVKGVQYSKTVPAMRFRDIHNTVLNFYSLHRPFKRALYFQLAAE